MNFFKEQNFLTKIFIIVKNFILEIFVKLFFSQILSKIKNKMTSILYQWILLFDIKNGYSDSFWRYKIIPPRDRFSAFYYI